MLIVFMFDPGHPLGGWSDFVGAFATIDSALAVAAVGERDFQSVSAKTMEVITCGYSPQTRGRYPPTSMQVLHDIADGSKVIDTDAKDAPPNFL
jgi:hypothetical protein